MNLSYCFLLMCLAAFTIIGCHGAQNFLDQGLNRDYYSVSTVYKDKTYAISNFAHSDSETANNYCKRVGGYLAEIDDWNEYVTLQKLVLTSDAYSFVLIAGTDARNEGTWIIQRTGRSVTFFDWGKDEPNNAYDRNYKTDEDCLSLYKQTNVTKMNDITCGWPGVAKRFMCEIPNTV